MTANEGLFRLQQEFEKSADVKFMRYQFNGQTVHFIKCEQMIDEQFLNETVVPRVQTVAEQLKDELNAKNVKSLLYLPEVKQIVHLEDASSQVYNGFLLIFFEQAQLLFSINIAKKPNRSPEETKSEVTIKGPRDNFIEDLATNIALIRKRLPTNSLSVEQMTLGRRSQTKLAILYFQDIADVSVLQEMKSKFEQVDTDVLVNGEMLFEWVNKLSPIFPTTDYTGRPDFAVQALIRGRFIILVDGVAYANITPINLFLLLKTADDFDSPVVFSSLARVLRIISILIGVLLPGFWLALTTYHPNQLPFQLLATVIQSNNGLPFPSALEMLLMLLLFELFREAGLRLPSVIGGTIGVVGGLIIGDAAIRAGITSPAMIVIIATSTIATYTLVNQSLVTAVSIVRIFVILLSALLGLFGFFIGLLFTLLYICNIKIFGVPYMNIGAELNLKTIVKSIFRLPISGYKERPSMLNPTDAKRSKKKR